MDPGEEGGECDDGSLGAPEVPENADVAEAADVAEVAATFDRIAGHFAETRRNPWPEVEAFVDDAPAGAVGLDVGCGNGRHAWVLARRAERVVGLDVSRELLRLAREGAHVATHERGERGRDSHERGGERDRYEQGRERDTHGSGRDTSSADGRATPSHGGDADAPADRALEWVQGEAGHLPLADDVVDLAVYVATVHHLPSREDRVASLAELGRVLRPGGLGLVSAWSTEHDRFDADAGFDTRVDWTLPDGEVVPRFYHVYDPREFAADLAAGGLSVEGTYVSSGNCYGRVKG